MSERYVLGAWCSHHFSLEGFPYEKECVDHWADAGLNVAMAPFISMEKPDEVRRLKRIMDRAAERDLRLILGVGGAWLGDLLVKGEAGYRRSVAKALKHFGDHPAMFGFYIGDEPAPATFPDACRAMRIHNELAPHLHNFLNHLPVVLGHRDLDAAAALMDRWAQEGKPRYLCYDCYEQFSTARTEQENLDIYFRNLMFYQQAAERNGLPFWNSGLSVVYSLCRPMTEDDFHWQLNTTIAHGAKGLMHFFFFCFFSMDNYSHAPVSFGERTEQFTGMRRAHDRFVNHTEPVVRDLTLKKVSHYGQAYGGTPLFDGSGLVTKAWADTPLIISEFKHANGSDYVMVVNNHMRRSTQALIRFRGAATEAYELFRFHNTVTEKNVFNMHYECWSPKRVDGGLEVCPNGLNPGQMMLYRVEIKK